MAYYVRFLTASEDTIPFTEIEKQGKFLILSSGNDKNWDRIDIFEPEDNHIGTLARNPLTDDISNNKDLDKIQDSLQGCYPLKAREWLKKYLSSVKTIYSFELTGDRVTGEGWPVLGRIQNLLRDALKGIIQADREGFYNENGDYVLWQMYEGAAGTIPAATLNENGEWIPYNLKLGDKKAVDLFKQGMPPKKSFLSRLFGD